MLSLSYVGVGREAAWVSIEEGRHQEEPGAFKGLGDAQVTLQMSPGGHRHFCSLSPSRRGVTPVYQTPLDLTQAKLAESAGRGGNALLSG